MPAPMIISVAAFVAVTSLVLLIAVLMQRRPAAVRRRLENHAVAVTRSEAKRLDRIQVLKDRAYGSARGANPGLSQLRPLRTAARELAGAGASISPVRFVLLRLFVGALMFLAVMAVAANPLFAFGAAVIGVMLPRVWLKRQARKRIRAFEAQLAEAIDLLVGALRAGHGFLQGLESVAKQMDEPTSGELTQVIEEVNVGINPVDALHGMSERLPIYDLALLVSAISVQRQTGGNLAEVLENLAATVRERRRVRGEVHALTTGPRVSSYVLGAVPVMLFAYFVAISADYRVIMLGTTYGHMLLGLAAVLSMLGYVFTRKVSKVEY